MTLHKLGIRVAGKDSKLQDSSRFVEIDNGLNILKAGTTFYFYDFDKERGFDKYKVARQMPKDPATASLSATFSVDDKGILKARMQNLKDPSDPSRDYPVEMTYGGGLYKQHCCLINTEEKEARRALWWYNVLRKDHTNQGDPSHGQERYHPEAVACTCAEI